MNEQINKLIKKAVSDAIAPLCEKLAEMREQKTNEQQIPYFSEDVRILQDAGLLK